jgi:hypothetical protein
VLLSLGCLVRTPTTEIALFVLAVQATTLLPLLLQGVMVTYLIIQMLGQAPLLVRVAVTLQSVLQRQPSTILLVIVAQALHLSQLQVAQQPQIYYKVLLFV